MRIALTGGGSGGHLFPILAVVREIKKIVQQNIYKIPIGEGAGVEFMFIGPETIGEELLIQENAQHRIIMAGKLRRYASLQNIFDIFKIPVGIIQALWHLFFFMPNVIFSKGGYGSVPVVIAAWIFRIPVVIHESDIIPGLANKICSALAQKIAISFPESAQFFSSKKKNKLALTGNPVRLELLNGTLEEAKKIFGLSGLKLVLLVLGGSQGAKIINDVISSSLPLLISRCEIIHQCGSNNYEEIKKDMEGRQPQGYFLFPFLDENQMKQAYAAANLVISRAGAGTIAEIATLGKPSILIPLPNSAADHQLKNAMSYAESGSAMIIDQMNLTPHLFQDLIFNLLDNTDLLKKMSDHAKKFNPPDAARLIAQEILSIAKW
ncbi:MAG: undecaprenyldiphospho-muramoylpentapeptide beta-N-acetylglucosaminyltransferase [Gammaproteobacteria bacterium RIFOXYB2_FULL_38_6]|nr:MAG: undecaprenyldiphospho-muramoylpentapeptide beta-N-acetylglucosaminyltransferase [Gammaproteobacteria bacterium RIFOXYB2_FULL_38_6]